jgi:hypothetical protein
MEYPHAAPLADALSVTGVPAVTLVGWTLIAAMGLSAAVTAPEAFAIPTPQVTGTGGLTVGFVQMHSTSCESSLGPVGTWHIGGWGVSPAEVCGNGSELCSRSVVS